MTKWGNKQIAYNIEIIERERISFIFIIIFLLIGFAFIAIECVELGVHGQYKYRLGVRQST